MVTCKKPLRKPFHNGSSFSKNLEIFFDTFKLAVLQFYQIVFLCIILFGFSKVFATDPTIVIHWSTVTSNGDPDLLKDRNGNPLSIGLGGNGSGYIATLGYFDEANNSALEKHFLGS